MIIRVLFTCLISLCIQPESSSAQTLVEGERFVAERLSGWKDFGAKYREISQIVEGTDGSGLERSFVSRHYRCVMKHGEESTTVQICNERYSAVIRKMGSNSKYQLFSVADAYDISRLNRRFFDSDSYLPDDRYIPDLIAEGKIQVKRFSSDGALSYVWFDFKDKATPLPKAAGLEGDFCLIFDAGLPMPIGQISTTWTGDRLSVHHRRATDFKEIDGETLASESSYKIETFNSEGRLLRTMTIPSSIRYLAEPRLDPQECYLEYYDLAEIGYVGKSSPNGFRKILLASAGIVFLIAVGFYAYLRLR